MDLYKSSYESSYNSEEDIREQQLYEGDEDEYVDNIKNSSRKCNHNKNSIIMGYPISLRSLDDEKKFNSDVPIFIRVLPDNSHRIDCFIYSEWKQKLDAAEPVFQWEGGDLGHTMEEFPVLLIPILDTETEQEIWVEFNYGLLSRYSAFLIYDPKQIKIGSSFTSGSRHGSLEYVWKVRPISKTQYLEGGIISVDNSVFSDRLDFAPGNYPGYDVSVKMVDNSIDQSPNYYCIESQTLLECPVVNLFYRYGETRITFSNFLQSHEYALKTQITYDRHYDHPDDLLFQYTGKKNILITGYSEASYCGGSSLLVEKLSDLKSVSVTYLVDDEKIWRETIKCDAIELDDFYGESEEEDEYKMDAENEYNIEDETTIMIEEFGKEMAIILQDILPDDVLHLQPPCTDSDIPIGTTILMYNTSYYSDMTLPQSIHVSDLKKLVIYVTPSYEDDMYYDRHIVIPYYPKLEYLCVYVSDKYRGVVDFVPPPPEDMEYTPLNIVYLRNVKLDQNDDKGLPVGLNVERLFLKDIRNNVPEETPAPLLFNINLLIEGDENPESLYGTYPNLRFLSIDIRVVLPEFPKLCTLFWTGDQNLDPSHPNPDVQIMSGDPDRFKSLKTEICEIDDEEEEERQTFLIRKELEDSLDEIPEINHYHISEYSRGRRLFINIDLRNGNSYRFSRDEDDNIVEDGNNDKSWNYNELDFIRIAKILNKNYIDRLNRDNERE